MELTEEQKEIKEQQSQEHKTKRVTSSRVRKNSL